MMAMMIKVITISYQSSLGGFNDEGLRQFMRDNSILTCQEYFFQRDGLAHLSFVLRYEEGSSSAVQKTALAPSQQPEESWKELLTADDMPVFSALREWRGRRARTEGVPPYIVFSNRELATIASKRPKTKAELGLINGVGSKKIEKYGDEVLSMTGNGNLDG